MHADDFRLDRYGVVSGLRDGGYSDDMTLAALAGNVLIRSYLLKFDGSGLGSNLSTDVQKSQFNTNIACAEYFLF